MILVVQIDAEVPPGRYADLLDKAGVSWRLTRMYADDACPDLDQVKALLVLGGAMGVNDTNEFPFLLKVKALIREALARQLPILGICLGGQLLADVAGASVMSGQWGEKGTLPVDLVAAGEQDPLFTGVPSHFPTFQWHNDSFAIPLEATLLASSSVCPHQAFRIGDNAYGLQFHPEVNSAIVATWTREKPESAGIAAHFVSDFLAQEQLYGQVAERLLHNFLKLAGLKIK